MLHKVANHWSYWCFIYGFLGNRVHMKARLKVSKTWVWGMSEVCTGSSMWAAFVLIVGWTGWTLMRRVETQIKREISAACSVTRAASPVRQNIEVDQVVNTKVLQNIKASSSATVETEGRADEQ